MKGWPYAILAWYRRRSRPYWRAINVEETPDVLTPLTVYAIGEGRHQWYVVMACPCGCEEPIHLSLNPEGHPRWALRKAWDGAATLSPSVWRRAGCRSHFFLRGGEVEWV